MRYVSEHWAALVNEQGVGLTVYVPQQYPYAAGLQLRGTRANSGRRPTTSGRTSRSRSGRGVFSRAMSTSSPATTGKRGRISRRCTTHRHRRATSFRLSAALDAPLADQAVTDVVPVARLGLRRCGRSRAWRSWSTGRPSAPRRTASAGLTWRRVYPHAPEQIGFSYALDTRRYANGPHQLLDPGHRQGRKRHRASRGVDRRSQSANSEHRRPALSSRRDLRPDTTAPKFALRGVP